MIFFKFLTFLTKGGFNYKDTRLLGSFAPISHFHCEHFLFVYIGKKKFRGFSKFSKIEFLWRQIFENSIIHKPSLGSRDVPQTNKQTNRQTDKPNLYIDYLSIYVL